MTHRRTSPTRALILLASLTLACVSHVAAQGAVEYASWYRGLRDLAPDDARGAAVQELTMERDAGTFHLSTGQINLLEPIDGRTIGAVFVGEGRFVMNAPDPVEQGQLLRGYGVTEISTPVRAAVFLFTDFTQSELEGTLTFGALEADGDAEREVDEAREYFTDGDGWVSRKVMLPLINAGPGFFYAHFSEDRGDPMIFTVDPHYFEEVALARRAEGRLKRRETVAQFHRIADYTTGRSIPQEGLDLIRITSYDIETRIEGNLDIEGRATATLRRLMPTYDWVPFTLFSELDVDSIKWGDGSHVGYSRANDLSDLWVDFSNAPADAAELTFFYSGEIMEKIDRDLWIALGTHTTWFPVYEAGRPIEYTLTFHTDDEYTITTVGTKVAETTDGDFVTTRWETPPVRLVTFNIGDFEEFESVEEGQPGLSVLIDERAHKVYGGMVASRGGYLLEQENMAEMVATDVRNSFRFFGEVYGPTVVEDFVATEIPYSHGEAYRGLVMLAWNTFQWTTEKGFDEIFRAHEVAHQWWGIGVRPATYRDWWIAEGFSEFSGWWYAARARGSMPMFTRRLETTREALLERRDRTAPVALGQRVRNSRSPEDYALTIYYKGAWVLHMLRTLLTDPDTGNDDAFTQVMNTFYTQHLDRTASTASFQQTAEAVTGLDLDWFFRQWVYGTSIPTYTFSYNLTDQPDGRVKATVRVRQEDVPDDFQMIVPILVDFGDDGSALVRINVTGPETEADLPLLPREPDSITFNPFESVLADTKTEGWRK